VVEPTAVVEPQESPVPEEPVSPSGPPAEAIFRMPTPTSASSPEPTRLEPVSEEEQKLAAERAARRDARVAAFAAPAPQPVETPKPVVIHKRTNDRFWGSLGLFLLRIVIAAIFAIRGVNILTDIPAAQAEFAKTVLADIPPGPQVWAIITGVASLLIALALLLGLLTRVAGLGVALIAGGALALVYWGPWSPFVAGQPGFLGEFQLVLAVVGVLLLFVGGGGWSLDRSFRAGREKNKRERASAEA
ncbi:DoxX family protein, partial [Propionicimonas sp.]|uniref:DoxX family protein n=1 Tax=Propionicimonas sp. TaxID=1955623 RepID=UPI0039E4E002